MKETVNHPDHYAKGRNPRNEPIRVIHEFSLNFAIGNAVKYLSRAGRKDNANEDLKKAKWYIDWHIENTNEKILFVKVACAGARIEEILDDWQLSDTMRLATKALLEGNLTAASIALAWYLDTIQHGESNGTI